MRPAPNGAHICFFTDSLEPSGVGVHLLNLMRWLHPERYQVSLVCPGTEGGLRLMARAARLGAEVHPLTVRNRRDRRSIDRLREFLQREAVTIFHSQVGISWEGLLGLRIAHQAGVPVRIVTEHLPYLLTHRGQVREHRETTRLADRVITVSEASRRTFLARGYPEAQSLCIHNGIDLPTARPLGEARCVREGLGLRPGAPLLLTVARMTTQKGHDLLLAAAPAILARHPQACFAWVGDGPEQARLRRRADALGLAGHVRFLGRRDDVPALLAAADLFILPSRFEGHPIAALEALAVGLPVVGTRVCGLSEAVASGESGLLVEPGHPADLAAAALDLLADSAARRRMGQAGRRCVAERFTAQAMAQRTMELYEELLREKGY